MSLPPDAVQKLHMALPPSRVHKRVGGGGKSLDYIAAHDAIRTANAIFGFGEWGSVVTDLTCVGQEQVVSRDGNKKGYRVGYRCTVLLSVKGCEPTSGVGYGDSMEYNDSSITPHENAAKEAESDALKRALKNYGDQFGLILYAGQGDERQRVEREAAVRRQRALSSPTPGASGGSGEGSPEATDATPVTASQDTRAAVPRAETPLPSPDLSSGGESGETPAGPEPPVSGDASTSPASLEPSSFAPPASVPLDPRNSPLVLFTDKRSTQAKTLKKLDVTVSKGREEGLFDVLAVHATAHTLAPDLIGPVADYTDDTGDLRYSLLRKVIPLWLASQMIDQLEAQAEFGRLAS